MTTLPPIVRPPVQTQQSLRPLFKNSEMCDWSGPTSCCSMSKQLKGGYLLRYKKKLFGKTWKEEWVVLYENSHLVWYKHREKSCPCPEGGLILAEAPELLAVGLWTLRIPSRPELPEGCHSRQLMAFGTKGRRVEWFLAKSEEEVNEWMTAISNTLPPPPTIQKPRDGLFSNSKNQQNNKSQPQNNKSGDLISSSCSCPCQVNYSSSGATTTNSNNTSVVREKSSYNYGKNYGKDYTTPLALGSAFYWNQMGIGYNWGWGAGWMTNDSLNSYNVAGDTFSSSNGALSSGSGLGNDFSAHSNSVADHSIGGLGGSAFDDIDSASSAFDGFGDFGF